MKLEFNDDTEKRKDLLQYLTEEDLATIDKAIEEGHCSLKSGQEWNGHVFLPGFSPEAAEFSYNNFEPTEHDVFIMSYPKTGNLATVTSSFFYSGNWWIRL